MLLAPLPSRASKRCARSFLLLGFLLATMPFLLAPSSAETPKRAAVAGACTFADGEDRTVTKVIDGETMQLDGGSEVRLIGALAPRAFDAASGTTEWALAETARAELEKLVAERGVRLGFAGRRTDRYGRLLAHVFAGTEAARVWLQGEMLMRGMARAYALEGHSHCLAELIAHEAVARETAAGLWADTTYAVRSVDETSALLRLAGTFQVVEGRVEKVSETKGTVYLNFGEDWRQDFTVVVRGLPRRAMGDLGAASTELQGRKVRVRGWIERRGGPLIEIAHPAAIEVLAAGAASRSETESGETTPRSRRRSRRTP